MDIEEASLHEWREALLEAHHSPPTAVAKLEKIAVAKAALDAIITGIAWFTIEEAAEQVTEYGFDEDTDVGQALGFAATEAYVLKEKKEEKFMKAVNKLNKKLSKTSWNVDDAAILAGDIKW